MNAREVRKRYTEIMMSPIPDADEPNVFLVREQEWLDLADYANRYALVLENAPPDGWFMFGSHIDCPWMDLEFSDVVEDDGLPKWERPLPPV